MTDQHSTRIKQPRGSAFTGNMLLAVLISFLGALDRAASAEVLQDSAGKVAAAGFVRENDAAMARMMAGMAIRPTGDVDADFVAMMIPHHQGAIDMAVAQLRDGSNPRLKRIAQEIIIEQQQEIAAMRLAIGQPLPPSMPAPTRPAPQEDGAGMAPSHHHSASEQDCPK